MHSRYTSPHPGSSLATHPASVGRTPWEYSSSFAAQHQTMLCAASRTCANNWQASMQQNSSQFLPFKSSAVTAYPLYRSMPDGQAGENKMDSHNVKKSLSICGGLCNSVLQGIGPD